MRERLLTILFIFLQLIVTLYIPLSYTLYSHSWYHMQIPESVEFDEVVIDTVEPINNLIGFFTHKAALDSSLWNEKEIRHYHDVRFLYDAAFIVFVLCFYFWLYLFTYRRVAIAGIAFLGLISLLGLCIAVFGFNYLFDYVFHPLLFSNNNWILTWDDLSAYLFPYAFFKNSVLLILSTGIVMNLGLIGLYMRKKFVQI